MPVTEGTQRLESIMLLLRRRGGRVTSTRRAIVAALLESSEHVTADGLAAFVRAAHPEVHLTTVYRCLDALERLGVVDHVHLGHGRAVYHLTDELHQHLVCERCGAVVEVPSAVFVELAERLYGEYGFSIRPHHFAVPGHCRRCQATGEAAGTI